MKRAIPFLNLPVHRDDEEVHEAIARVLESGHFVLGSEVELFEDEFSAYVGADFCIGVNSGTSALELILRGMGVGQGDEVLVPAYTAIATWMAVTEIGAEPIPVDVDEFYAIDPTAAAAARTTRTKAAILVHLLGRPADFHALQAHLPGLPIIEDCAQAHGARLGLAQVGSLGVASAFSFYPTKNLGALGDGGAVVTSDEALADQVRLLRSYGWRERSVSLVKAGNSRLDELQAAVLRVRLRRLDAENARRRELARLMSDLLEQSASIAPPSGPSWASSVWHLYVVQTPDPGSLSSRLGNSGVTALRHYSPLPHETPAFRRAKAALPVAERLSATSLSLPIHPRLTEGDIHFIASVAGAP